MVYFRKCGIVLFHVESPFFELFVFFGFLFVFFVVFFT